MTDSSNITNTDAGEYHVKIPPMTCAFPTQASRTSTLRAEALTVAPN